MQLIRRPRNRCEPGNPNYDADVQTHIQALMRNLNLNREPTPMEARRLFETVALTQRLAIEAGVYDPDVR